VELSELKNKFQEKYRQAVACYTKFKGFPAYTNWVLSNYEMFRRTSIVRAKPLKITIDCTNVCHFKCPLCPNGLGIIDRKKGKAKYELFERLLEEVGDYIFFVDFFNWGEPLTNRKVLTMWIRLANKKGIITSISTNLGLPFSDVDAEHLVASGLSKMIISIDGASQETYSTYRRGGDFNLVMKNLKRLVRIKRKLNQNTPVIIWQYLVFRFNEHEMNKAKYIAKKIGVDEIRFVAPYIELDAYPIPKEDREEMATWYSSIPKYNRYLPTEATKSKLSKHIAREAKDNYRRCDWLYVSSSINWDGSVAPCCALYKEKDDFGTLGRHGENSYMQITNNKKYRAARDAFAQRINWPTGIACANCTSTELFNYASHINREIAFNLFCYLSEKILKFLRFRPA